MRYLQANAKGAGLSKARREANRQKLIVLHWLLHRLFAPHAAMAG
jgi:hypothetical protein